MSHLTIGTAGHVDHGKSALVEALTGTHPDRLQEERERGMTIDLGFTFMPLSDGREVPIIDVPGHERFLKTMVAGVSGIHLVLFVVAADEGVMPQTVEHLGTLRYMGIENGLIVLTKRDLVDDEWLMLVEEDVRSFVRDTFLADAPIMPVSAVTGEGIPELKAAIERALAHIQPRQADRLFRLPIDRVFTMKGFGTVVAGTVLSGSVSVEDALELLPAGTPVRVRGMQTHNRRIEQAAAGQRASLNLANVRVSEVERGHELSVPGYLRPTMMVDAQLQAMDTLEAALTSRTRIRLHKGTAETIGRVIILDKETLEPGETGYVQFRLERPIVAERDERFIIRGFSSMRLLGGGRLIEVYPQKHRRFRETVLAHLRGITDAPLPALIERTLLDAYSADRVRALPDLVRMANAPPEVVQPELDRLVQAGRLAAFPGGLYIHRDRYETLRQEAVAQLAQLHKASRLRDTLPRDSVRGRLSAPVPDAVFEAILRDLIQEGAIQQIGHEIKLPAHTVSLTPQEKKILDIVDALGTDERITVMSHSDLAHLVPDARPEAMKGMLAYLLDQGILVEFLENNILHRDSLERIRRKLVAYLETHGTVRAAEFRDYLGISRAHATALLDYFHDRGVTQRESGTHRLRGRAGEE